MKKSISWFLVLAILFSNLYLLAKVHYTEECAKLDYEKAHVRLDGVYCSKVKYSITIINRLSEIEPYSPPVPIPNQHDI
jgi:hypothetical protein